VFSTNEQQQETTTTTSNNNDKQQQRRRRRTFAQPNESSAPEATVRQTHKNKIKASAAAASVTRQQLSFVINTLIVSCPVSTILISSALGRNALLKLRE
jgi:ABC-type glutathione transport system ATPase component